MDDSHWNLPMELFADHLHAFGHGMSVMREFTHFFIFFIRPDNFNILGYYTIMLSRDDVKKLAALARIKLSDTEEEKLVTDMQNILGYVTQIQEVSSSVEEEKSLDSARDKKVLRNVLRADENPHQSGIHTEAILQEAPKREGNYLKVKKIM